MYTVYMDGRSVYSSVIPNTQLTNAVVSRAENQPGTFTLTLNDESEFLGDYKMLKSICEVYRDDRLIFHGRPISKSNDFYSTSTIEMEGELGFLYDSIQGTDDVSGKQPREILQLLIDKHNSQVEDWKKFKIGFVTVVDTTSNASYHPDDPGAMYPTDDATSKIKCNYGKTFDELNSLLISRLGGFLNVRHESDGMYIDYYKDYTDYTLNEDQVIEFGTNLLDYSDSMSYGGICTGVIPLGGHGEADPYEMYQTSDDVRLTVESVNGGSEIIWNQSLVDTYGRIISVLDLNNINDPQKLYDKGLEYLNDTQFNKLTLNCKIIDLNYVDNKIKPINFLDYIRVISKPHGLDKYFPVSEISYDLLNPENDTVTLGITVNALTDGLIKQETSLNSQNHDIQTNTHVINQNAKGWWKEVHDKDGRSKFSIMSDRITSEVTRIDAEAGVLSSRITQNADGITSEVGRATSAESALGSRITQTESSLSAQIVGVDGRVSSLSGTVDGWSFYNSSTGTTKIDGGIIEAGRIDVKELNISDIGYYNWSFVYGDERFGTGSDGYKIGGKILLGTDYVDDMCTALTSVFAKMEEKFESKNIGTEILTASEGIYTNALQLGNVSANNITSDDARIAIIDRSSGVLSTMTWTSLLNILDNHYQKK